MWIQSSQSQKGSFLKSRGLESAELFQEGALFAGAFPGPGPQLAVMSGLGGSQQACLSSVTALFEGELTVAWRERREVVTCAEHSTQ